MQPDDTTARLIVTALSQSAWPRTVVALAAATKLPQRTVTRTLEQLHDEGVVRRVQRGTYALPPP